MLYGSGANGKSTFLRVLGDLLGDYAVAISSEALMAAKRHSNAPRPDLMRLQGARFVTAIETEDSHRLAEAFVKGATGGDPIVARGLYQGEQQFVGTFKLWLACNHKPRIRGVDAAIWRRVRLVPFLVTIPDAEQDRELPERLRAEWPGILAWAVRGCVAWQRHGLGMPEAVRRATAAYRDEQDHVGGFLRDRCHQDPTAQVAAGLLYQAYVAWCGETGDRPVSPRGFGLDLGKRGFEDTRTRHGRYRTGLRLLEPGEAGDAYGPVTLGDAYVIKPPSARAGGSYSIPRHQASPVTKRHP